MTVQDELYKSWVNGELHIYPFSYIYIVHFHNWYSRPYTYSVQFGALVSAQLSGNETLSEYLEGRISIRVLGELQLTLCICAHWANNPFLWYYNYSAPCSDESGLRVGECVEWVRPSVSVGGCSEYGISEVIKGDSIQRWVWCLTSQHATTLRTPRFLGAHIANRAWHTWFPTLPHTHQHKH